MATTKFYLDKRTCKGGDCPLKLGICTRTGNALWNLGVRIGEHQWDDASGKVVNHQKAAYLNAYITKKKLDADLLLIKLDEEGLLDQMTAKEIKDLLANPITENGRKREVLFEERFAAFAATKKESTRGVYMQTLRRMRAFRDIGRMRLEDVTKEWLTEFESFLAKTSPSKNARNIHLRNIRAVINDAIDEGLTTHYPFRKFKIRPVPTAKRSLTVEQMRDIIHREVEPWQEEYRDMFVLIFLLCGINLADLSRLKEVRNGRIQYNRMKTGRLYDIKVEPEAMSIIDKYRGKDWLLGILDRYKDHRNYMHHINDALKSIGECRRSGRGGKKHVESAFPGLSTYWARHTWATLAASLDIPKETIAAALGHGGNSVTDIYIDFDTRKVDRANRMVIDYVFYGKQP